MLEYQARVEHLSVVSGDIIPLKLRKGPITEPVKVIALVNYRHGKVGVVDFINDMMILLLSNFNYIYAKTFLGFKILCEV